MWRLATTAFLLALALLAPNLWGCDDAPASADATDTVDSSLPIDLTPAELNARLAAGPVLLLNVHLPYEGEIPGTTAHVPYDELPALSAAIGAFDQPVVLYCFGGSMSVSAGRELFKLGYTEVYSLEGGMTAWREQGYPFTEP